MATLTLAKKGTALQTILLSKERMTLGRRTYNDIVIDAPGISAEHAVIVTSHQKSCFEDVGSTNGSLINGMPSRIHFLQDLDVITLADYTLTYHPDVDAALEAEALGRAQNTAAGASKTSIETLSKTLTKMPTEMLIKTAAQSHVHKGTKPHLAYLKSATIKITSGPHAGKEIALTKVLTTIGQPGIQVAAFTINADGCSLTHVEGSVYPSINGTSIGRNSHLLAHKDIIALCGAEAMFYATEK